MTTHYSRALQGETFHETCSIMAEGIAEGFSEIGVGHPVLCYSGMSGIASATMMGYFLSQRGLKVGYIYVRKSDEESHGTPIETSSNGSIDYGVPVFVDDFCDTGSTLLFVMKSVRRYVFGNQGPAANKGFRFLRKRRKWLECDTPCYTIPSYTIPTIPHILTGENTETDPSDYEYDLFPELWLKDLDNT